MELIKEGSNMVLNLSDMLILNNWESNLIYKEKYLKE